MVKHILLKTEQIVLLESNPRTITDSDLDALVRDILADPTFLFQRPPLINLAEGRYLCYADCDQNHLGILYQATNWTYLGKVELNGGTPKFRIFGRTMHGRSVASKGWKQNLDWIREHIDPNADKVFTTGKHKYAYALDKQMGQRIAKMSKPYPKETPAAVTH